MTQGLLSSAETLLEPSRGGTVLTTARIECLHATMRERLATLKRTCRHAAHRLHTLETGRSLIGCPYNLCVAHQEVRSTRHVGFACTPALAAGLTDHIWSRAEVMAFTVAPALWVTPTRAYRKAQRDPTLPTRPRGRPRMHPLLDPTLPTRPRCRPCKAV